MAWFSELAGKAETILNSLDQQTGAAIRNHSSFNKNSQIKTDAMIAAREENNQSFDHNQVFSNTPQSFDSLANFTNNNVAAPVLTPKKLTQVNTPNTGISAVDNKHYVKVQSEYSKAYEDDIIENNTLKKEPVTAVEFQKSEYVEGENATLETDRQLSNLVEKNRKTADENAKLNGRMKSLRLANNKMCQVNDEMKENIKELNNQIKETNTAEFNMQNELKKMLDQEIMLLRDAKMELEDRILILEKAKSDNATKCLKLEKELRGAQTTKDELRSSLEKSQNDLKQVEKDWESYKLRVKNMLTTKDNQIRQMQEGLNLTEDSKILMEENESLRYEKEELEQAVDKYKNECSEIKSYMQQLDSRCINAEKLVVVLREAMKDERNAKNKFENECFALKKELKALHMETSGTLLNLQKSLKEKEEEIQHLQNVSSQSIGDLSCALNVADYSKDCERERIDCLTQTLVQKQSRIDSLLADNNMLKIQLDNLEKKYKNEISLKPTNHSVLNFDDVGSYKHRYNVIKRDSDSVIERCSVRFGVFMRRHPIFRLFILIYMIGLHFWVLTVLFTSTPDVFPKLAT